MVVALIPPTEARGSVFVSAIRGEWTIMTRSVEFRRVVHAGAALFAAVLLAGVSACGPTSDAVAIDGDGLCGVVSGPDAVSYSHLTLPTNKDA